MVWRLGLRAVASAAFLAITSADAAAQSLSRIGLESVIGVDRETNDPAGDRPQVIIDIAATVRLGNGWRVYVRPWFRVPASKADDSQVVIYQAALRYERNGRVATRIDAGYLGSPVGLGMLDGTPEASPTIRPHLSYFVPMFPFDTGGPPVLAIASSYPLGVQAAWSTDRWDLRTAVVSTAPTRGFLLFGKGNPKRTPVIEAGGGITPRPGLRFGMSFARGHYLTANERGVPGAGALTVTLIAVEAEYAFGHTKLAAEWVGDRFSTSANPVNATTWFVQGAQALTARWFVAGRREHTTSPVVGSGAFFAAQPAFDAAEATVGFRISPEFTLRGAWMTSRFYGQTGWTQQAGGSVVWARRWW